MNVVLFIGRVLFALIFLNSGIMHLTKVKALSGYAAYKKVPAPTLMTVVSGLMLLVAAVAFILGFYVDLASLLLVVFLVPTSLLMHNFWTLTDEQAKAADSAAFFKNIALAGASLMFFAMVYKHNGTLPFGWVVSKAHLALWK